MAGLRRLNFERIFDWHHHSSHAQKNFQFFIIQFLIVNCQKHFVPDAA